MFNIELTPDSTHCIETVTKRKHQEYVQQLLSTEELADDSEIKAEILRRFLETADFRKLRAESEPYIKRGDKIKFTVYVEDNILKYNIKIEK